MYDAQPIPGSKIKNKPRTSLRTICEPEKKQQHTTNNDYYPHKLSKGELFFKEKCT